MAMIIFVTVPEKNAETLIKAILENRCAACINMIHGVCSHYWWEGKIVEDNEVLLMIKTRATLFAPLENLIKKHHPYEVPEIVGVKIDNISQKYLDWLMEETRG